MAKASRDFSRPVLLDERAYEVRLRLTPDLQAPPPEQGGDARQLAAQAWHGMQVPPEEAAADRSERDKLERGMVVARKQVFAARSQAAALQGELEQARRERYDNPAVYGLTALAVAAAGAWLLQRRRLQALAPDPVSPVPASPAAFPPAVEPSAISEFESSDMSVIGDEADQWIQRARVAVPAVQ